MYYQCYDEAVKVGLNAYSNLEYSESCRSAFRVAAREFKEYMEDRGLSYSPELTKQWINNSKEHWKTHKVKESRKAMSILEDIMEHGGVTMSLQTKIERTPPYTQLPNWSRTILDNYLAILTCTHKPLYLTQIRNACSRFFLFLELEGISQPSEITHESVKLFFTKDIHISSKVKNQCNNEISHCLMYMADHGLVFKTVGLALNKFVIPDLIIVAELPEPERNRFLKLFNALEKDIPRSMVEYDAATKQLADKVKIHLARNRDKTVTEMIKELNPILRGWVNYYRIGHCSRTLTYVKIWVERKVRRFARKAQKKFGFGWKEWSSEMIYEKWGLYDDYQVRYYNA